MLRKYQVAVKAETAEGVWSDPGSSDALTIMAEDVNPTPDQAFTEGRAQSGTLARQKSVPGRSRLGIPLICYMVGSRDLQEAPTAPAPPDFDALFRACGWKRTEITRHYVDTYSQSRTYVRGETVNFGSGQTATVSNYSRPRADGTGLLVLENQSASVAQDDGFSNARGVSCSATAAGVNRVAYKYQPVSRATIVVTVVHADWSGAPLSAGNLLVRSSADASSEVVGWDRTVGLILSVSGSGTTRTFVVAMSTPESFSNGMQLSVFDVTSGTLWGAGGTAAAVSTVVAGDNPSCSIRLAQEAFVQRCLGARGNISMSGTAGEALKVTFTMTGSMPDPEDGAPFAGVVLAPIEAVPRLETAVVAVDEEPLICSSFGVEQNNSVVDLPDVHATEGLRGTSITDRDMQITVDPNRFAPSVRNWRALMRAGTSVKVEAQIGWQAANTFLFVAANGQITAAGEGDRDGVATDQVTISCRDVSGAADEDLVMYAF